MIIEDLLQKGEKKKGGGGKKWDMGRGKRINKIYFEDG